MTNNFYPDYDEGKRAAKLDRLKILDPNDAIEAVRARIPAFSDIRKTEYLVLRSVSFSHQEACKALNIDDEVYSGWMLDDNDFVRWAIGGPMMVLQSKVGEQVLRAKFLRNVFIQLYLDGEILRKKMMEPESMTAFDHIDAREASKRYSAANIAAMMKVLDDGNEGHEPIKQVVNINIEVPPEVVQDYNSKKMGAQYLLDKFTRTRVVVDEEGNVVG